jgi:hypothetical protein
MIILILNGGFVTVYTESTTVAVPLSELGHPHPSPQASVFPHGIKVGGHTHLWMRGWGGFNSDASRKSLVSVYSVMDSMLQKLGM